MNYLFHSNITIKLVANVKFSTVKYFPHIILPISLTAIFSVLIRYMLDATGLLRGSAVTCNIVAIL